MSNVHRHYAQLNLSIISIDEVVQGWQKVIRGAKSPSDLSKYYTRYTDTIRAIQPFQLLSFEEAAIHRFQLLKSMKLNVGANDLRIGSIAFVRQMVVATRNLRDYGRIPGLILEDWTNPLP